jgi:hypothetical protein
VVGFIVGSRNKKRGSCIWGISSVGKSWMAVIIGSKKGSKKARQQWILLDIIGQREIPQSAYKAN